jgi:hypothetical protein
MTEQARIKRNQDKLSELFSRFATRIESVIQDLQALGIRPRIQEAYRSPEAQLIAFNSGTSKLKFGFHNITGDDGKPESLAVDLLDDDRPLAPSTNYLLRLATVAETHGLETGVLWGLPPKLQDGVRQALASGDFGAKVKVGWDPTHIQPRGITVAEAKQGKRPT